MSAPLDFLGYIILKAELNLSGGGTVPQNFKCPLYLVDSVPPVNSTKTIDLSFSAGDSIECSAFAMFDDTENGYVGHYCGGFTLLSANGTDDAVCWWSAYGGNAYGTYIPSQGPYRYYYHVSCSQGAHRYAIIPVMITDGNGGFAFGTFNITFWKTQTQYNKAQAAEVLPVNGSSFGYGLYTFTESASYSFPCSKFGGITSISQNGTIVPDGYSVTYDLVGCTGDANNPTVITPDAAVTVAQFTASNKYAFSSGSVWIDGQGLEGNPVYYVWTPETGNLRIGAVTSNITVHVHATIDPYAGIDGETDIPGGGTVPVPSVPGLTATTSGVIGLFAPSALQMQQLADYMWTDFGGTGTTTEDILKEIVQALKRSISNPLDYVIGLNIIPSQGLSIGSNQTIRFGFVNSNVTMPRLTDQYFAVDCGSLQFDALCGDTFLDYAPYSKFSIYLPYIGVKDVDANDFVGHTISVMYRGDVVTGGVTAYILKDGSVMYQYSGCCALNVPLNADGWGSTIGAAVQIATSIAVGGMVGGAAGALAAADQGAASVATNPSLLSPQVQRSGAVSGGAGCMGVQYPFVIREAVRFHSTEGFNTVSGYPSYYYKSLSSMSGYTKCFDVHLTGIPGTRGEIAEIEKLLKEGVVF